MGIFDSIEILFQQLRDFDDYSKAFVTFATAFGALVIFIYTLKILYSLSKGLRLYIISQLSCFQSNYIERYGKWAVISGSTQGIGLGFAKEFARRGHSILVIGINDEECARTKELLEGIENVGEVETVTIDLSDSSLENFERIREQIDPDNRDIGILVNCAGIMVKAYKRFHRFDLIEFKDMVNVNLLAPVLLTSIIIPSMINKNKGLVVNISSFASSLPLPFMSIYGATKAFIDSFSKLLQTEYASYNLDITYLNTGPVMTKIAISTLGSESDFENLKNKVSWLIPLPDYYAKVVVNALSTRINNFTGTILHELILFIMKLTKFVVPSIIDTFMSRRYSEITPKLSRRNV